MGPKGPMGPCNGSYASVYPGSIKTPHLFNMVLKSHGVNVTHPGGRLVPETWLLILLLFPLLLPLLLMLIFMLMLMLMLMPLPCKGNTPKYAYQFSQYMP